jgi:alkyl sulfatase BDS1-like metallo-beta-lactamase superfamily hydrolase
MKFSSCYVLHERAPSEAPIFMADPLVKCEAGKQLVLAEISRQALNDHYYPHGVAPRLHLSHWNQKVEQNLATFQRIIEAKFSDDDWPIYNTMGQSYPKITVTLDDMKRSGEQFV